MLASLFILEPCQRARMHVNVHKQLGSRQVDYVSFMTNTGRSRSAGQVALQHEAEDLVAC